MVQGDRVWTERKLLRTISSCALVISNQAALTHTFTSTLVLFHLILRLLNLCACLIDKALAIITALLFEEWFLIGGLRVTIAMQVRWYWGLNVWKHKPCSSVS